MPPPRQVERRLAGIGLTCCNTERAKGAPGVANFALEPNAGWPPSTTALVGLEVGEGCAGAAEAASRPGHPKPPRRPAGLGRDPSA
jgi:hypothetical protein